MPKDDFFTLHGLVDNLTDYLDLTPEQQFRVTARIKRLIHYEKHSVYQRYAEYSKGFPAYDLEGNRKEDHEPRDPWIHRILSEARDNHSYWSEKPDEEIVTWDVGTHKFRQELGNCDDCSKVLATDTGYYRSRDKDGKRSNFCLSCANTRGLLDEEG